MIRYIQDKIVINNIKRPYEVAKKEVQKNGLPNIKEYLTSNMIMFDDNPQRISSKENVFG